MKKIFFAIAMFCGMATAANAQLDGGIFNHLGANVGVGTDGIDIELAAPITNFVQVRAGVAIMPKFSVSTTVSMPSEAISTWDQNSDKINKWGNGINVDQITKNGQALNDAEKAAISTMMNPLPKDIDATGKLSNTQFKLLFDVYPVPAWSFHVTAGFYVGKSDIISLYTTNCQDQLSAITTYNESLRGATLQYNGANAITMSTEMVQAKFENKNIAPDGPQMTAAMKVNGFKPYLGVGFGRAVPKNTRFAFACDMGVQFWGSPKFVVMDEELTKDDFDNSFLKTMDKMTVYPVVNFRLCGRIL